METTSFSFIFSVLALLLSEATADDECVVTNFTKVAEALKNCTDIFLDSLQVPANQTLKLHLNDNTTVTFQGKTVFGNASWTGPLVEITGTNVTIQGEDGSVLDGQAKLYWDKKDQPGSPKPRFFTLQLQKSVLKDIYVLNAPIQTVLVTDSADVLLSNWTIDNKAGVPEIPGNNVSARDRYGIAIWNSKNINVTDTKVYNQDDCVSVRSGDSILIDRMLCVGGLGLTLSVGFSNDSIPQNTLKNVFVGNSVVEGARYGVSIKTHADAANGSISNVTFDNIVFSDSFKRGINIQQDYTSSGAPANETNNIPISNLTFSYIAGSVTPEAIPVVIDCAVDGCFDWTFTDVVVAGNFTKNFCTFSPPYFFCFNPNPTF